MNHVVKPTSEYASVWTRLGSFVIDGLLVAPFTILFFFLVGNLKSGEPNSFTLIYLLVLLLGMLVFGFWNNVILMGRTGQSLGRRFLHIAVLDQDGRPIGIGNAFTREVIGRWLSSMFFYLGFLWAFWDKDKQMWHDKMVKSFVFYVDEDDE